MEQIKVEGMMCGGCERRVESALKELGLTNIKADHEKKVVSFENNNNTPLEKVKERINELGFEA